MTLMDEVSSDVLGISTLVNAAAPRSESGMAALRRRGEFRPSEMGGRAEEVERLEQVEVWWAATDRDDVADAFRELPAMSRPLRLLVAGETLDEVALFEVKRFLFHTARIAAHSPPGLLSEPSASPALHRLLTAVHPGGEKTHRFKLSAKLDPGLPSARSARTTARTAVQERRSEVEAAVVSRRGGKFDVRGRYRPDPSVPPLEDDPILVQVGGEWRIDDGELTALEAALEEAERTVTELEEAARERVSAQLRADRETLEEFHAAAVALDVRVALVELRQRLDGCWGTPAEQLRMEAGRHPQLIEILARDQLQPIDFAPADIATKPVVVTGPNMGGKSMLLELVGVCQWAAQHAFPVPARRFEFLPVDRIVYVGAEETGPSVSGLSSFGREVHRVVRAIQSATGRTLWLFDEFGRGTHPEEGASIAIDLFSARAGAGDLVLVATHFPAVAAMPAAEHFRIAGLVRREALEALSPDNVERQLRAAMDYQPISTKPSADDVPRDARLVAKLLGLDLDEN